MNYTIEKGNGPAYLQLYKHLRNDIINGTFEYNTKLPSKRILAEEVGVSTITIEHSYALLCDEGYAEARERSGYFVIFQKADGFATAAVTAQVQRMKYHTEHTQSTFPYSILCKTMRKVLTNYEEILLDKSPNSGCVEFRTALKNYLARNRGIHVDIEQIVIGSGTEYLYGLIVQLFGRDRTIAIETPSYNKIEQVYQTSGINYELLPLTNDGIDSAALASANADILHTTPYRSYPSGVTASASKRHEYIRWSGKAERYIIEDDFESEFSVSTKPMETLFSLSDHDNVIYLNTFTKTISPAIRVAYIVLPKKLVDVFYRKLGFYSCTVPTFEQYTLTDLLNSGEFERYINRVRRNKRKELENKLKTDGKSYFNETIKH